MIRKPKLTQLAALSAATLLPMTVSALLDLWMVISSNWCRHTKAIRLLSNM